MKHHRFFVGLLCAGAAALLGCADKDSPTASPPGTTEYPAYFATNLNDDSTAVFRLWVPSGQLDTLTAPEPIREAHVSADGRRLYLVGWNDVLVMDTVLREVAGRIPLEGDPLVEFHVSPNDQTVAVIENYNLTVYETATFRPIFADTVTVTRAHYTATGDTLLAAAGIESGDVYPRHIYQVDLLQPNKAGERVFTDYGHPVSPHSYVDDSCVLYEGRYGDYAMFDVYDLANDTLITRRVLHGGYLNMVRLPRSNLVVYGNVEGWVGWTIGDEYLRIFDLEQRRLVDSLDLLALSGAADLSESVRATRMVATPDGRWLLLGNWIVRKKMMILDLSSLTVHKLLDVPSNSSPVTMPVLL